MSTPNVYVFLMFWNMSHLCFYDYNVTYFYGLEIISPEFLVLL